MTYRYATKEDLDCILKYIKYLAKHERRPEDVTATKEKLYRCLFILEYAYVVLAEHEREVVGYAFFYPVVSSYSCSVKMHIEDLFLNAPLRGKGLGREFMQHLANIAKENNWSEMEWNALDWNTEAIGFYDKIGAKRETGRVYFKKELT